MLSSVKTDTEIRHLIESSAIASMRVWVWMPRIQAKARHHSTGVHWLLTSLAELVSSGFNERPGLKTQGTEQLRRRTLDANLWPLQVHMHTRTHTQTHMHMCVPMNN